MAVLYALGFASGLPLYLTGQTLQAWMSSLHMPTGRIAALSSVGLAYTLKFLWAPLLDRFQLPILGRRRGWALAFQLGLIVAIVVLGNIDVAGNPSAIAIPAVIVAFLSASQDVVLDAYSTDLLAPHERAAGAAVYVVGYRTAMLVTGSVALVMGDHLPWRVVYMMMAALMTIGVVATVLAEEPAAVERPTTTLAEAVIRPFVDLWRRFGARDTTVLLAFAALYQFGYFFSQAVITKFLNDEMGFSLTELGTVNKACVFAGTAMGGLLAGGLVARHGPRRLLTRFGLAAAATHLLYALLAVSGHSIPLLAVAALCDSTANAMCSAIFVSVLMSACTPAASATQYALLTSLASVGHRVFGPFTSNVVAAVGWPGFFVVTAVLALPGIGMALLLRPEVAQREANS
jgi:PAT family beta-lactamase induction signal transducer AmpG